MFHNEAFRLGEHLEWYPPTGCYLVELVSQPVCLPHAALLRFEWATEKSGVHCSLAVPGRYLQQICMLQRRLQHNLVSSERYEASAREAEH